jgi:predicted amidohydrolase YtcJ
MTPDLILLADTVHTLDPRHGASLHAPVHAVAVTEGRITAVGTREDAAGWRGPGTAVADLGSGVLVPGLVDSHIHPVFGLELTTGVDLSGAQDLAEVRRRLQQEAAHTEPGGWVRGWGLDPNAFGGSVPHRSLLDGVLGSRPALVRLFDGHSALASTRALELAGIDGPRSFDQGAQVVCDPDGPTGLLLEAAAMELVARHQPAASFAERKDRLAAILGDFARAGLTGGHVMDHSGDAVLLYRALEDEGELPVRLRCAPWCQPGTDETGWAALAAQIGTGGRRWSVDAVKLFVDGTVDNGTAWLFEPDTLGESVAPFWPRPAEYSAAVRYFASHGVPTATHAIGDAGVAHVLDALEAAGAGARGPAVHRIEHLETVPDELVARFAELGWWPRCSRPTARITRRRTRATTGRRGWARCAPGGPGAAGICGSWA